MRPNSGGLFRKLKWNIEMRWWINVTLVAEYDGGVDLTYDVHRSLVTKISNHDTTCILFTTREIQRTYLLNKWLNLLIVVVYLLMSITNYKIIEVLKVCNLDLECISFFLLVKNGTEGVNEETHFMLIKIRVFVCVCLIISLFC